MPAHLFPSPAKLKKGKGKEGAWAGAAGGEMGTSEAPAPPAESAAGTGPWH